jgi:hypothetical protein
MQWVSAGFEKLENFLHTDVNDSTNELKWILSHREKYTDELKSMTDRRSKVRCEYCYSRIPTSSFYYNCSICFKGSFDSCKGCVENGVLCFDAASHTMRKQPPQMEVELEKEVLDDKKPRWSV